MAQTGSTGTGSVFPLRPLTVGEVLDAAVVLLRRQARPLLVAGFALALVEQLALYPLLWLVEQRTGWDQFGLLYLWFCIGLGTEAAIIALLAAPAAQAASAGLVGQHLSWTEVVRSLRPRLPGALAVVVVVGPLAGLSAAMCGLPWLLCYGFLGLAVPALVVERIGPGRALVRSLKLVGYSWFRAGGVRLLGYLGWFGIRIALFASVFALLGRLGGTPESAPLAIAVLITPSLVVNTVMYPALGCLDAVVYLETRMRVEGLDIAVSRSLDHGETPRLLAEVPR